MIFVLFFCSGATALIYEVIWAKYLALMFGSTIQAQTVVLAVFMGGLALGNALIGSRADWLQQPLAAYGYVEGIIGLYAFFFDPIYGLVDDLFVAIGSGVFKEPFVLLALKSGLSVLLLLLPTVLMGGTLPLIAAWLQQREPDAGRRSARFYAVNSLGAVFGSWLAGFVLIQQLGLVASAQATALVNVVIAVTAIVLARRQGTVEVEQEPIKAPLLASEPMFNKSVAWVCGLVALTGGVSMGLEVLASRSLAMIVGASSQAFAIVLIAFILGIGMGSAVISSPRARVMRLGGGTFALLVTAGVCIGLYVLMIEQWVVLYSQARAGLAGSEMGYIFHQILVGLIAIVVLGLPAALLGSVLPLWIRILSGNSSALGSQVGRLLTWNTIGAVLGVLLTGFVLMPRLGIRASLATLAIALMAAAALLAWMNQLRRMAITASVTALVFLILTAQTGESWQRVLGSGVFRHRTGITASDLEQRRQSIQTLFYKDAADATVAVETTLKGPDKGHLTLRINGKPDASTRGDLSTQYLLAHLPLAMRPDSKDVFVLGFGSGITAGALLGHPVEHIHVAENCAPVLRAAHLFAPWNRGVLTNSRTQIAMEDARTVLKLSPKRYDIIISEPSNPWVAGIGGVFSREFYELAADRLRDGGLMAQWFHVYEMHDGIVQLVLRTFASVFPYIEVWEPQGGDIILLGAKSPWECSLEKFRKIYERPEVRADLERAGLPVPEALFLRQIASQNTAFAIPGDGPTQSDFFPVLETAAPKAFFIGASASTLALFDERVWQSVFAPEQKRLALRGLSEQVLVSAFNEFGSSSPDLMQYVNWRADLMARGQSEGVYTLNAYVPIIFREPSSYPRNAAPPRQASPELTRLMTALAQVYSAPERRLKAVETIEEIVRAQSSAPRETAPDWKAGYYASVAAKARFAMQDLAGAQRIVEDALPLDPNDPQLAYLKRLFEHLPSRAN